MKIRRTARHLPVTLSALALSFLTVPVYGQNTTGAANRGTVETLMEEVLVTARRREESLDDLPQSVTAFTAEGMEVRGADRIDALGRLTPNLTFQNNPSFGGSSNSASVYIRGIGQKDFTPTTDPGVGIYVDGVYIARSVGAILDLVEFERVEVLRGPQGTLFGRNTIGGVINITTSKPGPEFGGNAFAKVGTDSLIQVKGSLNIPFNDQLFLKIAGASFTQDGYVKRDDGAELGDDDTLTARADLRWEASDDLTFDLSFDYSRDDESGPAMSLIDIRYGLETIDPSTPPFVFFNNVAATLGGSVPNPLPPGPPPPECATDANPINLANPLCYDDRYLSAKNQTNFGTAPSFSESDIWGTSLTIDWNLTDWLRFKSITAYREVDSQFSRDGDHSSLTISQYFDDLQQEQVTQEFQLLGSNFDDRFNWILGFFYFDEEGTNENLLDFIISSFRSGGAFENQSTAVFGQATWDITDRLHLTAGLRWTEDEKSFTPDQVIFTLNPDTAGFLSPPQQFIFQPGTPILPSVKKTLKEDETTPMVNLSFDFTDVLLGYVSYTEGFKSGGFTQRVLPPLIPGITCPPEPVDCIPGYEPEFAKVYEAGFRAVSDDNRLRLSGAVFRTEYDDLQISVFTSVAPVTRNAGGATIDGFELEGAFAPGADWLLEGSLGYLDAGYDEIDPSTQVDINNKLERVSEWSANAAVSKDFFLNAWSITPRLDWAFRSELFNDAFNSPQLKMDDLHLVNFAVSVRDPDQRYLIAVGINNLTDEEFLATGVFGDAFSSYEGVFDRGRQWYVRLGIDF